MANLNKVFLIGNLTRDPELRYTPSGTAVVEIGMAVNRKWKGQNGELREEVCFVDVSAFGRQAEIISEYCHKGKPLFVEGRLKLDSWEGKDGQKRSKMRVVVENFQLLGVPGPARAAGESGPPAQRGAPRRAPAPAQAPQDGSAPAPEEAAPAAEPAEEGAPYKVDDDIPF